MEPLVSIIIPFYGTADEALLQRCIKSIHLLRLNGEECEVIVTDDDGNGLGAARNKGLARTKGRYVMFVDADDYLLPGIAQCIAAIEKNLPDVCSFGMSAVKDEQHRPFRKVSSWSIYPTGAEYMKNNNFTGSVWRHLFRRAFLDDNNITFATDCYHEDEDFIVKAYCKAGITIVTTDCFYGYYTNPASITRQTTPQMRLRRLEDFHAMLIRTKQFLVSIEAAQGAGSAGAVATRRRLSFLTIDYIRLMWRNRCPKMKRRTTALRTEGLLPLHKADYTWKYRLARMGINLIY